MTKITHTDIHLLKQSHDALLSVLVYAVTKYGKEGGPWNVSSDPGGWLDRARRVIENAKKVKK